MTLILLLAALLILPLDTAATVTPDAAEVAPVVVGGSATWYVDPRHPSGLYAAAGPLLRSGHWRGRRVTVCNDAGTCVRVVLSDWCACGDRHGVATVIDLSATAFARLAPLSAGVVRVSVSWSEAAPAGRGPLRLPPTDTAGGTP